MRHRVSKVMQYKISARKQIIEYQILILILSVANLFPTSRGQGADLSEEPKLFENTWSFAVIGGVFFVVLVLYLLSRLIGSYKKSKLPVVYDGCGPSDYKVKYQVRVKTGSMVEVSSGNAKMTGSLAMDLCKPNGTFIARMKVPEEPEDKDMNIGLIRLDYSKFGERVFVHYIEIKGLEGSSSIYRCFVSSKIGLLKTVREDLIATTQTYPCKKNEGVTDNNDPVEFDLTPFEFVLFFMVSSSVHCLCSRYFLYDVAADNVDYTKMAISGVATGFLSLFITFLVIVVYRIALKKNLGSKIVNVIRIILLILLIILSFAFYVASGILGSDLSNEQLKLWSVAIAVGLIIIIVIGIPLIVGFQYCCQCVSPELENEENETITKTLKSGIRPESGLQPTSPLPKTKNMNTSPVKNKQSNP